LGLRGAAAQRQGQRQSQRHAKRLSAITAMARMVGSSLALMAEMIRDRMPAF